MQDNIQSIGNELESMSQQCIESKAELIDIPEKLVLVLKLPRQRREERPQSEMIQHQHDYYQHS